MRTKGKIIGDAPCPQCKAEGRDRTGNHLILFADGGSYCNRCGYTARQGAESMVPSTPPPKETPQMESLQDIQDYPIKAIPSRKLSQETCEHFGVRVGVSPEDGETITHIYYPRHKNGNVCAYHVRTLPKDFHYVGDAKGADLFGMHCRSTSSKAVYVTEGADDAMALYQSLTLHSGLADWRPTVVSVGGAHARTAISNHMEFFDSFDKIVLVLDNDKPGQEAASDAAKILPAKTCIAVLPLKDPNDMVMANKAEDLKWAAIKAKPYQPDNIVNGADAWDSYLKSKEVESIPYPSQWSGLNSKSYGVRPGSIVTVASGSGCGKTQFLRELKYHYHCTTDYSFADIALEEGLGDTIGGMLSLHLNKRITLPDVHVDPEEERAAYDYIYGTRRWELYDHFGGMDDDNLFTKIRYFAAKGCKMIFLDHLSIIVSEYASEGGERERIDTIMTKLAKIVKEFGIVIFLVVHLKKTSGQGIAFEEGLRPTLDDLRGSGSIKQLSWDVIFLTRNQQHPEVYCANTSLVTVGKCRFTGRTGDADYLHFDDHSGRLRKVERPANWDVKEAQKQEHKARF